VRIRLIDFWRLINIPSHCSFQYLNCIFIPVDNLGRVAVAHIPQVAGGTIYPDFSISNGNFFPVTWQGNAFPSSSNSCGGVSCQLQANECICNAAVIESVVFLTRPTVSEITMTLFVGSVPPSSYGSSYTLTESVSGVEVYQPNGILSYTVSTIFGVAVNGQTKFFKNMKSTVIIGSGINTFSFRNPPHFMNFMVQDSRDAMFETDAVIDHYFYHPNVAPFISRRIIQRFGISNPSPRYVTQAATAFSTGSYTSLGITFGDGKYGNLGAMLAAIVLDREARSAVLDADPTFGSLREPMIKLMAFLRAMKFKSLDAVKELSLFDLSTAIGQKPYESPNVFSYFLPDFTPSGSLKDAFLVGPEAQVHTSPTIVGFLNGIISLIELGLTTCYSGFGDVAYRWYCPVDQNQVNYNSSDGFLTYTPSSLDPQAIIDELALLLTSGRLNSPSRKTLIDVFKASDVTTGLKTLQKLIVTSPSFHITNLVQTQLIDKPDATVSLPSGKPYKAVVFVNLAGGMDSFNILMPRSQCIGTGGKDLYVDYKTVRGELALDNNTMLPINSSSSAAQPCKTFGIHPSFSVAQQLYNEQDLVFLANVGVLQEYVNSTNYLQKTTKTQLFAHNEQYYEIAHVDILKQAAGFGVCGRMVDVIKSLGYKAGSSSANGVAAGIASCFIIYIHVVLFIFIFCQSFLCLLNLALVSKLTPLIVVDPNGIQKVNPIPWASNITDPLKRLNKIEKIGSSLYGETWSDLLLRALGENQLLYDAFTQTTLETSFSSNNYMSLQYAAVSKLIKNKGIRGVDRDVFYVDLGSYDSHANMLSSLDSLTNTVNEALSSFVTEMKAQGRWNDVVVVFVSEFARTLIPNTSSGR